MRVLRTYARADASDLDEVLGPLATATGEPPGGRFTMPDGLELAAKGGVLVIAGDD